MTCREGRFFRGNRAAGAWAVLLALILLMGACKAKAPPPPPPPSVTVAQPVQQKVTDYLDLTGNTQAIQTAQLVARVAGYLDKLYFQDGQVVKEGQLLFLIQQNTYQDSLRQAEAAIIAAEGSTGLCRDPINALF